MSADRKLSKRGIKALLAIAEGKEVTLPQRRRAIAEAKQALKSRPHPTKAEKPAAEVAQ